MSDKKSTLTLRLDAEAKSNVDALKEATGKTSASQALIHAASTWPQDQETIRSQRDEIRRLRDRIQWIKSSYNNMKAAESELEGLLGEGGSV